MLIEIDDDDANDDGDDDEEDDFGQKALFRKLGQGTHFGYFL